MDSFFHMGACTRSPSPSLSAWSSSVGTVNSPTTDRSAISDDEDILEEPLDIVGDDSHFIMVVGGLGFIGSNTVLELVKAGHNVLIIDDLSNAFEDVLDRIKYLAASYYSDKGGAVPLIHFRRMDYRSPAMQSVLAEYSSYTLSGPPYSAKGAGVEVTNPRISGDSENRGSTILRRECKITGVIHFAAFKSVEESIRKPLQYYQNNVVGLVNFLSLLQEVGIRNFVFSSSATVYGGMANIGAPLREEYLVHHPETYVDSDGREVAAIQGSLGITNPYGRTKYFSECILADLARADPSWNITALRYFNPVGCHESGLLGEDPRQKPSNLIPVVAQVLTGQKPQLEIFGSDWNTPDGTCVRDFIHVTDLARGHIAALRAAASGRIKEPFRAYNLGTGTGHTVREVVESLEAVSAKEIPVVEVDRRAGDVGFCVADVKRAEAELSWKANKTLEDCARDVWNHTCSRCESLKLDS